MGRPPRRLDQQDPCTCRGRSRPITLRMMAGQVADCREAGALIDTFWRGRHPAGRRGPRERCHPRRGETAEGLGQHPVHGNRKGTFAFSAWLYRQRNLVERSSTASNTSEASPPDTTRTWPTTSPPSNSSQHISRVSRNESLRPSTEPGQLTSIQTSLAGLTFPIAAVVASKYYGKIIVIPHIPGLYFHELRRFYPVATSSTNT